ncbi:MAG: ATP-binding cassette domain-containing protein [Elainellaceae cyanobacterium]
MIAAPRPDTHPAHADPESAIHVRGLQKRYGKLTAVKGIDFSVQRGEIFGLIGPDGAGKTTTFHILAGIMEPTDGTVWVLNRAPRDARLRTGYLTQQFSLYLDLSIDENLRYSAGLRQVPEKRFQQRRQKYLELMGLAQIGDRLAGALSGGMKQKLALCTALVSEPDILLLDEPTTGVDPVSRREFWDVLANLANDGSTIVVATPYLDEAERCHRIALMYDGQIQQIGTLEQLRQSLGLERLQVRTEDLRTLESAEQVLHTQSKTRDNGAAPMIADVQTFGDRLDVLVKDAEQGSHQVRSLLEDHQFSVKTVEVTDPTLENVFVTRLRQQGSDPPFIPFPRTASKDNHAQRNAAHGERRLSDKIAIGATNLKKRFGDFEAVKGVDLEVHYGEIYGLLGANGAGKTTTIKMLCGLIPASAGTMVLAEQTQNLRSRELRRRIGYMSQKFTLYDDLSIGQNLEFYCGVYGVPRRQRREKIDWVLTTSGLEGQENLLTGKLPGGWKQRVAFGASVMHAPDILFLDEPTSGVDPLARRQFWRLIEDFARNGTAVIVTTHYLEEAEHCNRMGFMVAGRVVSQGTPNDIKTEQPGQLFELTTRRPQAVSDLLKTQLDSWKVSIFGDRLHVVLDDPTTQKSQIQTTLEDANLPVQALKPISFSLEDAFIGIVERARTQ